MCRNSTFVLVLSMKTLKNHPQKVKLQKYSVLPKSYPSANTVENSLRFFNVSYILVTHHKTSQILFNLYFSPCSIMVTMTKHPPPKQSLRDFPSKSIEDSIEISQCSPSSPSSISSKHKQPQKGTIASHCPIWQTRSPALSSFKNSNRSPFWEPTWHKVLWSSAFTQIRFNR